MAGMDTYLQVLIGLMGTEDAVRPVICLKSETNLIENEEKSTEEKVIYDVGLEIDIKLSNSYWTNQDITATITYSQTAGTKQYQFVKDGSQIDESAWITITESSEDVQITENGTIYAKKVYSDGSENATSLAVINIDKTPPKLKVETSRKWTSKGAATQSVKFHFQINDSLSGIKEGTSSIKLKYCMGSISTSSASAGTALNGKSPNLSMGLHTWTRIK